MAKKTMDIKISLTTKGIIAFFVLALCGLIACGCWSFSSCKSRHDIKATCHENCACFNNVVDYRLTNHQAKRFALFMKDLQQRKNANALEFMELEDVVAIQRAFTVCQQQAQPQPQENAAEKPAPQPQKTQNKRR